MNFAAFCSRLINCVQNFDHLYAVLYRTVRFDQSEAAVDKMIDFAIEGSLEIKAWRSDLRIDVNDRVMALRDDGQYGLDLGTAFVAVDVDLGRIILGVQREADIDHEGGAILETDEGVGHILDGI